MTRTGSPEQSDAQRRRGVNAVLYARRVMLAAPMPEHARPGPAGRTFIYWLAQSCKKAREEVGLRQQDIPINQSMVSRFEGYAKWPKHPESLVQAYAQAIGLKDSRMLWELALDLWLEHGQPPMPIEARPVPGIPEGELLQRLRADLPSDQDPAPPATAAEASRSENG